MKATLQALGIVLGLLAYGTVAILTANWVGGQVLLNPIDPTYMDGTREAAFWAWLGIVAAYLATAVVFWWIREDLVKDE